MLKKREKSTAEIQAATQTIAKSGAKSTPRRKKKTAAEPLAIENTKEKFVIILPNIVMKDINAEPLLLLDILGNIKKNGLTEAHLSYR